MSGLSAESATIFGAVIGLFGAIIGSIIGGQASVRASRHGADLQFRNFEAAKFRSEFTAEVMALRTAKLDVYQVLSEETLQRHKRAMTIFESLLARSRRQDFWGAWVEHAEAPKTTAPGSTNNRKSECDAALKRIEKILAFAELPTQ